jgi:hypothetical protein
MYFLLFNFFNSVSDSHFCYFYFFSRFVQLRCFSRAMEAAVQDVVDGRWLHHLQVRLNTMKLVSFF